MVPCLGFLWTRKASFNFLDHIFRNVAGKISCFGKFGNKHAAVQSAL